MVSQEYEIGSKRKLLKRKIERVLRGKEKGGNSNVEKETG